MEKKVIKSLNEGLPEFFLDELEQRLETDPLNVGALVNLYGPAIQSGDCIEFECSNFSCKEFH